jgi:hypothetical protein
VGVIYLKHDTHGCKVATSTAEAAYDKTHGWYVFDPVDDTPAPDVVNEFVPKRRTRRSVDDNSGRNN